MSHGRSLVCRRFLLLAATALLFGLLLTHPGESARAVRESMAGFCTRLVPVLFPYMVLSHLFSAFGLLDPFAALLPVHRLFRMDRSVFGAFAMGQLCGYPVGAAMTASLCQKKKISPAQGELLLALSGGASPAFLLHAVGGALWGSMAFGGFLYGLQLILALAVGGILGRRLSGGLPLMPGAAETEVDTASFARCFCEAVGGSFLRLASVGGYIVFFSLLSAIIPLSGVWQAAAAAILEFASGTAAAASLGGDAGLFLTGFAVGCGGLSVLLQTAHMTDGTGLRLGMYCRLKLLSGLFCGAGAVLFGRLVPLEAQPRETAALVGGRSPLLLFLACWLTVCLVRGMPRREKRRG